MRAVVAGLSASVEDTLQGHIISAAESVVEVLCKEVQVKGEWEVWIGEGPGAMYLRLQREGC